MENRKRSEHKLTASEEPSLPQFNYFVFKLKPNNFIRFPSNRAKIKFF